MATVRVYLPTYRRATMLTRALASLRAQTFTDWICEVHNDCPGDQVPARLVRANGDARIQVIEHERNLGGTAVFNLFFQPSVEPFYTILEDDNWWDPAFLSVMLVTAATHPDITVFWANMHVSEEMPDGEFRTTGRTIWQTAGAPALRRYTWGQQQQVGGALHSNGAALFRIRPGDDFCIPAVPFAVIEPFRERKFPHPLLLVTRPLATYSITRQTARSRDASEWAEMQAMLVATFFAGCPWSETQVAQYWSNARKQFPTGTTNLILAALADPAARPLLRHAHLRDWWVVLRGFLRRPGLYFRLRRSRHVHADWWQFLEKHTAVRWSESDEAALP